ncbi:sensor histidine kinase [Crocosphaera sp. XPORK-15E]|uniref:sensor histidine kinase n=1 Tax=Crocosphaera sp. XPORK-15E TaxID=3110247 RepID=UPI002B1FC47A|nr:ATP-binding protein [Crocosphaera sp. XPORK-15E]MEA5537218.1 ATP-binding protein [Crocosphaera sp. XPORK-15E]
MDIEVAINLVDKLVFQKNNQHLSCIQINLLRSVWLNQSYEELAEICYCSVSNIKMVGSAFWTELSQILGEKVTKRTVRAILESYHQDLKQGKLRRTTIKTGNNNNNLRKTANTIKTIKSEEIPDSWFDSEILFRLTERLDNSLKTISTNCNTDLIPIKSLSEKLQLINSLSRQKYSLNRTSLDIINICRNLINDFNLHYPNRRIILSLFEEPVLPHYDLSVSTLIDEKLVQNILKNLLSNALQYSNPESIITLDLNVEEQKGIFTVIDEGIGIPPDELEQVFQPCYSATNARQWSGDGLGLTIVEKSVRLHQGQVSVASQLKQGSTFIVVLPVV